MRVEIYQVIEGKETLQNSHEGISLEHFESAKKYEVEKGDFVYNCIEDGVVIDTFLSDRGNII